LVTLSRPPSCDLLRVVNERIIAEALIEAEFRVVGG
jgi:hypothetical protein